MAAKITEIQRGKVDKICEGKTVKLNAGLSFVYEAESVGIWDIKMIVYDDKQGKKCFKLFDGFKYG